MVGIAINFLFLSNKIGVLSTLCISIAMVLISIAFFVYASITKEQNNKVVARKDVSPLIQISSVFFVASFLMGIILSTYPIYKVMTVTEYTNDVSLTGVVSDYIVEGEKNTYFILDKCTVDDKEVDCKVLVYSSPFIDIKLGDVIKSEVSLEEFKITSDYGLSNLVKGIGYTTYINYSKMTVTGYDATAKDCIRSEVKDILASNLSDDNADIMFSIIFGESVNIDSSIKKQFSYAGISHILAVSGLHVSVLFSIIYFILKKCRVNSKVSLGVISLALLGYSYLCAFSPSVCRASIMTFLMLLCDILKIEYDRLSSLSIAGIVILIISPLQFFSVSFRLSFLCVFAIITCAPLLSRVFCTIKIPRQLSDLLAISVSINIVTLVVMMNTFDEVSLLGVITNLLVVPIFSVLYSITFIILILAFIIRPLGVLLYAPNLVLHIIRVIADYVASIPVGVFRVFRIGYLALFVIGVVALVIHFLMVSNKLKTLISLMLIAFVCGFAITSMLPYTYSGDTIRIYYSNKSSVIYYLSDNGVTLIGSDISDRELSEHIKDIHSYAITNVIAYDMNLKDLDEILDICDEYSIENLYIPSEYSNLHIDGVSTNIYFFESNVQIGNLKISTIEYYDDIPAIRFDIKKTEFLVLKDINKTEGIFIQNEFENIDYIIADSIDNIDCDILKPKNIICSKVGEVVPNDVLNLKLYDKIDIRI